MSEKQAVVFPRQVDVSKGGEDIFFDTLYERIRQVWRTLSDYEAEVLEVSIIELGHLAGAYVISRLESQEVTAVSSEYVFIQRWSVPNVWKWPRTVCLEEQGVPVKDFPLNYDVTTANFKILAWREKLDGVPYTMESNSLVGEKKEGGESTRILLPKDLAWVQHAERIRDTFFVLYPYKKCQASFEFDGIEYQVKSHEWRTGRAVSRSEGVVFLTDRGEYRLKSFPTAEIKSGDQVWEVSLQGQSLVKVRPRHTSKYRSEADAMSYLARQPFLRMYDIYVPESEIPTETHYFTSKSMGDNIRISAGLISDSLEYENLARIYTSAKALIQDKYGRFLLIQEGSKMWDLPGGKCEFLSEPPSQILRRELKEELAWDVPFKDLMFKNIRYTEASVVFMYHFVVRPFSTPSNTRWVTVDEYLSMSQKEMVSWLPSLFTDMVSIDRKFVYYSEESEHRLLQRCKPYTPVTAPLSPSGKMDMGGNPVTSVNGQAYYSYPVVPGSGELWHVLETTETPTTESGLLDMIRKSDTFLYHEYVGNYWRLWGRRGRPSALRFVTEGPHTFLDWQALKSDKVLDFIFYERAVTFSDVKAYFPAINQQDLDRYVALGQLEVKKVGEWNFYSTT